MLEKWNCQSSQGLKLFLRISLDIFEEAIGEPFGQCISNDGSYGADKEEKDERTNKSPVEDHGQRERKLEHELVSLAFCELALGTDDTPL